jgi:hypothetical protein
MSPAAARAAGVVVNSVLERETCVDGDESTLPRACITLHRNMCRRWTAVTSLRVKF